MLGLAMGNTDVGSKGLPTLLPLDGAFFVTGKSHDAHHWRPKHIAIRSAPRGTSQDGYVIVWGFVFLRALFSSWSHSMELEEYRDDHRITMPAKTVCITALAMRSRVAGVQRRTPGPMRC